MKRLSHRWWIGIVVCGLLSVTSCVRDDDSANDGPEVTPGSETLNIQEKSEFDDYINMETYAGDDFYQYATGKWLKNNPLKAGQETNGTMADDLALSNAFMEKLIKDAADGTTQDPLLRQLYSDWNATTMDAAKKSLKAVMKGIDDVSTMEAMCKKMGELMGYGYQFPFTYHLYPHDHTVIPYMEIPDSACFSNKPQASLQGIADLTDAEMAQIMVSVDKLRKMLDGKGDDGGNGGNSGNSGNGASNRCLTCRHQHTYANSVVYQVGATRGEGNIDLISKVLAGMELGKGKSFRMSTDVMDYGDALSEMTLDELKNLMKYFVMARDIEIMPAENAAESDKLRLASIKWLVSQNASPLSLYIGNIYDKTINPEIREDVKKMEGELRATFKERIQKLTWMGDASKAKAIEKLEAMHIVIGWLDTEHPEWLVKTPQTGNYYDDVRDIFKQNFEIEKDLMGQKSADALKYAITIGSPSYDPGASYISSCNTVFINSTNLNAPTYCKDKSEAYNLALMGATTLGHEMTHAFDATSISHDKMGVVTEWLDADSKANFDKLLQQEIDNFNALSFWPNYYCDGRRTLLENMADLGGLCIAYDVLMKRLAAKGVTDAERDFQAREFFRAFAFAWMENFNQKTADFYLSTDPHAAGCLRVNGNVYLLDEFYRVFNITKGAMYRTPDKRFQIW